jgi:hypothetical protein
MSSKFLITLCAAVLVCLVATPPAETVQDENLKEQVKPSIDAGVDYLKRNFTAQNTWMFQGQTNPNNDQVIGCTALCAIALMECGMAENDPIIKRAGAVVRAAADNPQFKYTYSVCLSLVFLDRVNKRMGAPDRYKADADRIKRLAFLIINGQSQNPDDARWGYTLPGGQMDNSNTQFAVVALWIARKYVPRVDIAFKKVEKKLRASQGGDGSWTYDPSNIQMAMQSSGSMTCAGVLGLALHAGSVAERNASFRGEGGNEDAGDVHKKLEKDEGVRRAKTYLMNALNSYANGQPQEGHVTYFLWSLERVATVFKWGKRDGFDWFPVGAKFLMSKQQRDGSWNMDFLHGPNVDTAFALLFLAKSNLLGELQTAEFKDDKLDNNKMKKLEPKKTEPLTAKEKADDMLKRLLETNLPNEQNAIIQEMVAPQGGDYSEALISAIDKLSSTASKEMARDGLVKRFIRQKDDNLQKYLVDNRREMRLASVLAIKEKALASAEKKFVNAAALIPVINDQDLGVANAALEALKLISGQDFGKSIAGWSRWLDRINSKKP